MTLDELVAALVAAEDLRLIRHAQLVVSVPNPNGSEQIGVELSNLQAFAQNPEAFIASYHGVSVDQYRHWIDEGMSVRCAGRAGTTGWRCRNIVVGGSRVSPQQWLQMKGRFCNIHEGRQAKSVQ